MVEPHEALDVVLFVLLAIPWITIPFFVVGLFLIDYWSRVPEHRVITTKETQTINIVNRFTVVDLGGGKFRVTGDNGSRVLDANNKNDIKYLQDLCGPQRRM